MNDLEGRISAKPRRLEVLGSKTNRETGEHVVFGFRMTVPPGVDAHEAVYLVVDHRDECSVVFTADAVPFDVPVALPRPSLLHRLAVLLGFRLR